MYLILLFNAYGEFVHATHLILYSRDLVFIRSNNDFRFTSFIRQVGKGSFHEEGHLYLFGLLIHFEYPALNISRWQVVASFNAVSALHNKESMQL